MKKNEREVVDKIKAENPGQTDKAALEHLLSGTPAFKTRGKIKPAILKQYKNRLSLLRNHKN